MTINNCIEYTNLNNMNSKEIKKFTKLANEKDYFGLVMLQNNVLIAKKYNSNCKIITVAGFPPIHSYKKVNNRPPNVFMLGFYSKKMINYCLPDILENPVIDELDVIFPILWYSQNRLVRINKFLKGVKKRFKKTVKVIIELGTVFSKEEKLQEICKLLEDSGIDILKTNSGLIKQPFNNLVENIKKVKEYTTLPIKASGGIKTYEQCKTLVELGVTRIGTSALIEESSNNSNSLNIIERK